MGSCSASCRLPRRTHGRSNEADQRPAPRGRSSGGSPSQSRKLPEEPQHRVNVSQPLPAGSAFAVVAATLFASLALTAIGRPAAAQDAGTTVAPTPAPTATAPASASVLPGEAWIVYQGPISGGAGNPAVRPDGSGDHFLTPDVPLPPNGWQVHPDWSAGWHAPGLRRGRRGRPRRVPDVWSGIARPVGLDADGTHAERVLDCTDPCTQADHPAWSPDGRTLAFIGWDLVGGENIHGRLGLLDLETGEIKALLTVTDDRDAFAWPRWSPDGRRLVVEMQSWSDTTSDADMTRTAIGVVDLNAESPSWRQLTDWTLWATYPDWHPDTDLIVFQMPLDPADPTGPSDLHVIEPSGGGLTSASLWASMAARRSSPHGHRRDPHHLRRAGRGLRERAHGHGAIGWW